MALSVSIVPRCGLGRDRLALVLGRRSQLAYDRAAAEIFEVGQPLLPAHHPGAVETLRGGAAVDEPALRRRVLVPAAPAR